LIERLNEIVDDREYRDHNKKQETQRDAVCLFLCDKRQFEKGREGQMK
jgi:hypothetical protein